MNSKKNLFAVLILFSVFTAYFSFGISNITKFVTTDEQFWHYTRIPKYWNALKDGKFKQTRINDKPGVSLALVSGPALLFANPEKQKIRNNEPIDAYRLENNDRFYAAFRLPILLFNSFLILYLFWVIKKISNIWIALWSATLIALFPILLGISRISNPDALLWSFSATAIFSYLALLKTGERKFILLTALFTGFALLSKYVANILFAYFFIALLANALYRFGKYFDLAGYFRRQTLNFFLIFAGALAVFSVFMPAVFLKPKHLYAGTIGFSSFQPFVLPMAVALFALLADAHFGKGKISRLIFSFLDKHKNIVFKMAIGFFLLMIAATAANWISGNHLIGLEHIDINARSSDAFVFGTNFFEKIFLEAYPFVFTLTPLALLLILAVLVKGFLGRLDEKYFYVSIFSTFITVYLAGGIFSNLLLTPRYMIMLFPMAGFMAALGLHSLTGKYADKRRYLFPLLTGLVLLAGIISSWKSKPFYYNYASSLLPQKYFLSNTWGFGGYEAAQYLNSLPEKDEITVWSDYRGVCEFAEFRCIIARKYDREKYPIDYYVLTRRGQSQINDALISKFEKTGIVPRWELFIGGRPGNYVKIFKSEK